MDLGVIIEAYGSFTARDKNMRIPKLPFPLNRIVTATEFIWYALLNFRITRYREKKKHAC